MNETNQIISLSVSDIGEEQQQTVNARELHAFLEVKTSFKDWIRRRIEDFGFSEGVDYAKFEEKSSRSNLSGVQGKVEYHISINMAKELSMVERNAKGKQARLYFIDCEKKAKAAVSPQFQIPQTLPDALRLAADLAEKNNQLTSKNIALEATAAVNAPKVAFADGVTAKAGTMCITAAAKVLGIGPQKFFDWLRLNGFLYKQSNQAMQSAIDAGYMAVRFADVNHKHSKGFEDKPYAHITGKGLYYFYRRLLKEGLIDANQSLEFAA